jgi:hypothetical protein
MGGGLSSCVDGWVVSRHADGGESSLSQGGGPQGGGPSVWGVEF